MIQHANRLLVEYLSSRNTREGYSLNLLALSTVSIRVTNGRRPLRQSIGSALLHHMTPGCKRVIYPFQASFIVVFVAWGLQ